MDVNYRETLSSDVDALFEVRASTRENPISRDRLARMGITTANTAKGIEDGTLFGWVCTYEARVIGFCTGHSETGEILVLAVLPAFEGRGVGKELLSRVVSALSSKGLAPLWLAADSNPNVRSYGFYRRLGWMPTGEALENGDQVLELASPRLETSK